MGSRASLRIRCQSDRLGCGGSSCNRRIIDSVRAAGLRGNAGIEVKSRIVRRCIDRRARRGSWLLANRDFRPESNAHTRLRASVARLHAGVFADDVTSAGMIVLPILCGRRRLRNFLGMFPRDLDAVKSAFAADKVAIASSNRRPGRSLPTLSADRRRKSSATARRLRYDTDSAIAPRIASSTSGVTVPRIFPSRRLETTLT